MQDGLYSPTSSRKVRYINPNASLVIHEIQKQSIKREHLKKESNLSFQYPES